MRLFFKHLINSIKARPMQPIILIFTLLLSMLVNICAFSLRVFLDEEILCAHKAQYGEADLTITLNGDSRSRFMFTDQVCEVLSDDAKAAGCYALPLYLENSELALGAATDFNEIGNIFQFEFSEYGLLTEGTLNESAFISRSFAVEHSLTLGERFTVQALGYEKVYTVAGISEIPFFSSYDVMVNITGVMRLLASDSLFVAALGDDFKPCSIIYIDVKDGVSTKDCEERLKAEASFSDKSFSVISNDVNLNTASEITNIIINIVIVLVSALASAVVFCCFYILASQRVEENTAFKIAGARSSQLIAMQYAEGVLYFLIGGLLGTVCAIPLLHFIILFSQFQFVLPTLSIAVVIKSAAVLLLTVLLTVTVFVVFDKMKQKPAKKLRGMKVLFITLFVLFLILFAGLFVVPMSLKLVWSFVCGLLFIVVLFVGVSPVFLWIIQKIEGRKRTEKNDQKGHVCFNYSIKNICKVPVLHNTCRLMVLLCTLLLCTIVSITSVHRYVDAYNHCLKGDYAVINAMQSCRQKIESCESVKNVYSIYFGSVEIEDKKLQLLSVSDIDALSNVLKPDTLPIGNQAVLTKGYADRMSLRVGDTFSITVNEKEYELTVVQLIYSDLSLVLFDCTYFDLSYNLLSVTGNEDISNTALRQELTDALALEVAAVIPIERIVSDQLKIVEVMLKGSNLLIAFVIIFSVLGMLDNLIESYRARKKEFELYRLCGMSKGQIFGMKFCEVILVFLFGIMIGLVAFAVGLVILNQGISSLGYGLFLH